MCPLVYGHKQNPENPNRGISSQVDRAEGIGTQSQELLKQSAKTINHRSSHSVHAFLKVTLGALVNHLTFKYSGQNNRIAYLTGIDGENVLV